MSLEKVYKAVFKLQQWVDSAHADVDTLAEYDKTLFNHINKVSKVHRVLSEIEPRHWLVEPVTWCSSSSSSNSSSKITPAKQITSARYRSGSFFFEP